MQWFDGYISKLLFSFFIWFWFFVCSVLTPTGSGWQTRKILCFPWKWDYFWKWGFVFVLQMDVGEVGEGAVGQVGERLR